MCMRELALSNLPTYLVTVTTVLYLLRYRLLLHYKSALTENRHHFKEIDPGDALVGKKIKSALFHLNKVSVYKIFKITSLKSGSVTNAFRMTINIDQHSENIIVLSN